MVEFDSIESAKRAKSVLNGCDIYSGCCTLRVEYAKVCYSILNGLILKKWEWKKTCKNSDTLVRNENRFIFFSRKIGTRFVTKHNSNDKKDDLIHNKQNINNVLFFLSFRCLSKFQNIKTDMTITTTNNNWKTKTKQTEHQLKQNSKPSFTTTTTTNITNNKLIKL